MNFGQTKRKEQEDIEVLDQEVAIYKLIVWNDDVNTFDWVIESLIEICNHTETQATQCAYIVHYNGKCDAKKGDFETLKPMCEALIDRGISATIE
jgi:ATP-dependent Clp protease adaptor protein ClpS